MPQVRQGTLDAPIAPGGVFFGHPDHELFDFFRHWWPSQLCEALTPIKLLGDEATIPAQDGAAGGNRRDLVRAFPPEWRGERSKSTALGISEAEPVATELGCEDAVFREEVGDDLLLLTLEPASNDRHQELEDHRRSLAWRQ
jgi:hypothetical protein